MSSPKLAELSYEAAVRALELQERGIEQLRARAGMLLAASSLTGSFVGAQTIQHAGGRRARSYLTSPVDRLAPDLPGGRPARLSGSRAIAEPLTAPQCRAAAYTVDVPTEVTWTSGLALRMIERVAIQKTARAVCVE
jgi:hypothetical protein